MRRSFDHPLAHLGPLSPSLSRRLPAEAWIARVAASVPTIPSFVASHQNSPDQRSRKPSVFHPLQFLVSKKFNQSFVTHSSPNVISTKKQNPLLYCHYHPSPTPTKVVADTDMILNALSITYDPVCISRYALYFCTFLNALSEMRCVVSEDLMHGMLSKFNKTYIQILTSSPTTVLPVNN